MLAWLRSLFHKRLHPLTGAPPVRRLKNYSSQGGYVYQYFYEGHSPASRDDGPGAGYVFSVSADRQTWFPVTVFLSDLSVRSRQCAHSRDLNSTERYAAVKTALFQALDERSGPAQMREEIRIRPADIEHLLSTLGIE